jgi:hypothetical protein
MVGEIKQVVCLYNNVASPLSDSIENSGFGLERNNFTFVQYYQEMKTILKISFFALAIAVLVSCAHRKHSCAAYNQTAVSENTVD